MNDRKKHIRKVALDLLSGRISNPTVYPINQYRHLEIAVVTILDQGNVRVSPLRDPEMDENDKALFDEVWIDLILERKITLKVDQPTFFRIHSEAKL